MITLIPGSFNGSHNETFLGFGSSNDDMILCCLYRRTDQASDHSGAPAARTKMITLIPGSFNGSHNETFLGFGSSNDDMILCCLYRRTAKSTRNTFSRSNYN
jgi:hypothetical protein